MGDRPIFGWQLDPAARAELRLARVDQAMARLDWVTATVELEELLDDDPDHADALWRLAEVLIEQRDFLTAREACRAWLELHGARLGVTLLLAHCAYECCAFAEAAEAAEAAVRMCEDHGEAHFMLSLALERLDRPAEANHHNALAHRCSPMSFPLPHPLTSEDWRLLIADAFAMLPRELQEFWSSVPVHLERFPDPAELRVPVPPVSPQIPALYLGKPPDSLQQGARPDAVRIYTGNLERADSVDAIVVQLSHALEQEAMDWLPDPHGPPHESGEE